MKNLTFVLFALLSLSLCFSSCGDDSDMTRYTVIPGEGFVNLKIGDPGSKVEDALGKGFETVINVGTSGNATYNYFNESKGIDIVFGQQDSDDYDINTLPVKSVYLYAEFEGMTQEGIRIGSTKSEVIATYGEPDEVDWYDVYYIGMLISYDDMDMVRSIYIVEI